MNPFLSIDLPAMITAILAAVLCAISGTFLVARKEAMMTDTLSHCVLPGLVIAFILTGTLHPAVMFIGALAACLCGAGLIALLQRVTSIKPAAAMGLVFTTLFALGIVLLEKYVGSKVHLDAQHALYGALELSYWPAPYTWAGLPATIKTLSGILLLTLITMPFLYPHLKLTSFDPVFARTCRVRPEISYIALLILTVLAAVACFDAVGVVLVIALFVCPAATARLYTHDLHIMMGIAVLIGIFMAIAGYVLAAFAPPFFGFGHSLSASGMIAVTCGLCLGGSIIYKAKNTIF